MLNNVLIIFFEANANANANANQNANALQNGEFKQIKINTLENVR